MMEEEKAKDEPISNRYIANTIVKAKKKNETAFPSGEIESLTEIAYKTVAENFHRYPELTGVEDYKVLHEIVKLTGNDLPITTTARNIDFEFYWEEKCKTELKNIKKEHHGNSYKQAYLERHIQKLLENFKSEGSKE